MQKFPESVSGDERQYRHPNEETRVQLTVLQPNEGGQEYENYGNVLGDST